MKLACLFKRAKTDFWREPVQLTANLMAPFVHQLLILHRPRPVPLSENGTVLHPGVLVTKWLGWCKVWNPYIEVAAN